MMARAPVARGVVLVLLLAVVVTPALAREPRRDPQTRKIRLKYIGDCLAVQTPTRGLEIDPLVSLRLIPSSIQELAVDLQGIQRYMRLYMPRTANQLWGETDVVMLSNSAADYFRPEWLNWVAEGTEDQGLGLVMIGGLSSFGGFDGYIVYPDWGETRVGVMLPVETYRVESTGSHVLTFKLAPYVEDDPLLSAFDWRRGPPFHAINLVKARPGSSVLAISDPEDRPLLVYQDVGKGSALAFMSTWGSPWGNDFVRWEYFIDFSADIVYYSAGLEIPDPVIVHEIRLLYEDHKLSEEIVRSVMDFVDRLGGRTVKVHRALDGLLERRGEADGLYIEQDYPSCRDSLVTLLADLSVLSDQAMQAKDEAFLWIYLTEWSAVTATVFLSGYFLYYTMIRRRLYHGVGATRLE